jgi:hypothetical protein
VRQVCHVEQRGAVPFPLLPPEAVALAHLHRRGSVGGQQWAAAVGGARPAAATADIGIITQQADKHECTPSQAWSTPASPAQHPPR